MLLVFDEMSNENKFITLIQIILFYLYKIITMLTYKTILLALFIIFSAHSWCLKTTINMTSQANKIDYSPDGTLIAITSIPTNKVYIY